MITLDTKVGAYELDANTIAALQLRFPLANVQEELLKAAYWLKKNPSSRPKLPLRFVENWLKKTSPKAAVVDVRVASWWKSEQGTLEMAKKLGVPTRRGEDWSEFRERISAVLRANSAARPPTSASG